MHSKIAYLFRLAGNQTVNQTCGGWRVLYQRVEAIVDYQTDLTIVTTADYEMTQSCIMKIMAIPLQLYSLLLYCKLVYDEKEQSDWFP